ncbi:MAG: hypothetical protein L3K24_03305 [Gammaproteobacteria bacterium]|nr:hypothetical protein [Gammaproteobacteria bacterium]
MNIRNFSVIGYVRNIVHALFVIYPRRVGRWIAMLVFSLILTYVGIAHASVMILEPENRQTFQNKTSIDFKIKSITGLSGCRSVQLFLTINGNEYNEGYIGSGTKKVTKSHSIVLGSHTAKARIRISDVKCGTGQISRQYSNTIGFSTIRVPDVDITNFSPMNGVTVKAGSVVLSASAASMFGGLPVGEILQLELLLNSTSVGLKESTSTPLSLKVPVQLAGGDHRVTFIAKLIKSGKTLDKAEKIINLRVPETEITRLSPIDGTNIDESRVMLSTQGVSKFGGVKADEKFTLQLFLDSLKIFSQEGSYSPLNADIPVTLESGRHTATVNLNLVNTISNEILANTTETTQFIINQPFNSLLIISDNVPSGIKSAGRILRHDGETGVYASEFVPHCILINPWSDTCEGGGRAEHPVDLTFGPDGRLYVADAMIGIYGPDLSGIAVKRYDGVTGEFGKFDDEDAAYIRYDSGGLAGIGGLVFGSDGNIYVSDPLNNTINRYQGPFENTPGAFIDRFVASGSGGLNFPTKLTFGPNGNLYVVSGGSNVLSFHGPLAVDAGAFIGEFVQSGSGGLIRPRDLAFGSDNNLYIASETDNILRYQGPFGSNPGLFIDEFISSSRNGGLGSPQGMAFGPQGDLYVSANIVGGSHKGGIMRYDGQTGTSKGTFAFVSSPRALIFSSIPKPVLVGDLNNDECVDRTDLNVIFAEIRSSSGEYNVAFDFNVDGKVNVADARKLVTLFNNSRGVACDAPG